MQYLKREKVIGVYFMTLVLSLVVASSVDHVLGHKFQPNWESLDSRPLPEWYDQSKIGIFLHWGVYSVPSFGSEWFWTNWNNSQPKIVNFMKRNYRANFTYQEFAREFTAELYDPDAWAELFQKAGARYVVLTSKHHDGYTLWPSSYSFSWNAKDVGPGRDLLGPLAEAVRKKGLRFGNYYSLFEWFNPLYLEDKKTNWSTSNYADHKMLPELKELVTKYKPEVLWSDGDWEAPDTYWRSREFLAWLYNDSPVKETVVTNDRWGSGTLCEHGGFLTCADRYTPGHLMKRKWENAMTVDRHSWGYTRTMNVQTDVLTPKELVDTLVQTVSCGGNMLINVGPTKEGTIVPIFQERLLQVGQWLSVNGEAIYESKPWKFQNDTLTSGVWYTADHSNAYVFAIALQWPEDGVLKLRSAAELFANGTRSIIRLLGNETIPLKYKLVNKVVQILLPSGRLRSEYAWVLKIPNSNS